MAKIKDLIICAPQLGLSPDSTLGGEVYDREVLERIANLGARIHVYLPKNRKYKKNKNFVVEYAPIKHIVPPYIFSIFVLPYLIRKCEEVRFAILRVHSHFIAPAAIIFKLIKPEVKVISHYHLDHEGAFVTFLNKILFKYSDLIIADSHFLKNRLINKFPGAREKIKVIHTGVDQKQIKPIKRDIKLIEKYKLSGKFVITFLGRFVKRKNPHFLIKLMESLPENFILLLIGDGPEKTNLLNIAKSLNVEDRVIFPGILFGKEKLAHYSISDVFAFPSKNEGFVLAVLEAMSAGLPLILPKSGAFPEAVTDGVNGFLVKPDNANDIKEKIIRLSRSLNLKNDMSIASRQRVLKEFTWDITAKKNLLLCKNLIK